MIILEKVSKVYAGGKELPVTAVQDVDLHVSPGEFVILTGRSGSGKTTLLNLAAGLARPTGGRVRLDGVDLWSLPDAQQAQLRNAKVGFAFQFPSLLPALTARENVALPAIFARNGSGEAAGLARAVELLEMVGLAEKAGSLPRQLSAGQQQRVVIARALFNHPQVLMADEPTSNLDEQTEQEIMQLFQQVHASTGVTILMVTHSSQLVGYGTRALRMANGRIEA